MEAAALNAPPPWLEKIVLRLIPPCAREAVAGDLWETSVSPRQYAAEALRTVPLVILSQMRRNLNLPVLLLQVSLVCFCLGEGAAFALLPVLMLRDAYQEAARPCPRRAMRTAIVVASAALVFLQVASMNISTAINFGMDRATWTTLLFVGPMLSPLMGLFRTGLIMDGDRRAWIAADDLSTQELTASYRAFALRARWHNMVEGAALVVVASFAFFTLPVTLAIALTGLYLLVAFYLLLDGAPRALPAPCDFVSLRALYQRELTRRQQLRRFLWWLWFTPVLAAIYVQLVEGWLAAGKPMLAVFGSVAALLLCFLVVALNREYGGRVREQVGLLDRMRERLAPSR